MADGKVSAIELKGIVRNRTKIGVEDGMAEDLINLRFVDGSWRTSGDGRHVYSMTENENGYSYSQLFVHTNTYHHLIGYRDGGIYWFANIDNDGVFEPISPRLVCNEVDDTEVIYAQTGHLLTIIKNRERITIFFNKVTGEYEIQERMTGDNAYSHPIGNVQYKVQSRRKNGDPLMLYTRTLAKPLTGNGMGSFDGTTYNNSKQYVKAAYTKIQKYLADENSYYGAFLVCIAVELYSGKWGWATAPTLVYPSYLGDTLLKDKNCGGTMTNHWIDPNNGSLRSTYYKLQDPINSPVYIVTKDMMTDGEDETPEVGSGVFRSRYRIVGTRKDGATGDLFFQDKVIVADASGTPSHRTVDGESEYTTATGLSSYEKLPTMGDCFFRPNDNYMSSSCVFSDNLREHIVWGKLNDLYINIDQLNIQQNAIYKNIGVFITPMLGGDGNPLDFDELSFNDIANTLGKHHTYQKFPIEFHSKYSSTINEVVYSGNGARITDISADMGAFSCWRPDHRFSINHLSDAKTALANSQFYLIKKIPINEVATKTWIKIELDEGTLATLGTNTNFLLPTDAFTAMAFVNAKYGYMYNGRLHLANYRKSAESIWGMRHIINNDYSDGGIINTDDKFNYTQLRSLKSTYADDDGHVTEFNDEISQFNQDYYGMFALNNFENLTVTMDALPVPRYVGSSLYLMESPRQYIASFIPYANTDNNKIDLFFNKRIRDWTTSSLSEKHYKLELPLANHMTYYGINFFFNIMDTGHNFGSELAGLADPQKQDTRVEVGIIDVPNGLLVSATDTPMYFPAENAYQVGNSEIVAMAANAIAVGTGQTGDSPLYVFTKDGIYGLFVDETGQMAYINSRILARDIINNMKSIEQTDSGVVFTTDRGLMMMAGEKVVEIGQPAEGDVLQFFSSYHADYIKTAKGALEKVADLPSHICDSTDFLTYAKSAMVSYNHNERELIISNPNKKYSYVLDRNGNWSRRDYSADEYVNNYPTSYRVYKGEFYKIDEEGFSNTSLEQKKEAPNDFFYLSNIIKLDSIGFKEAHRFVVRGYFETQNTRFITSGAKSGTDSIGSIPIIETIFNISTGINKLPGLRTIQQMRGRTFRMTITNNGNNTIQMGVGLKQGSDGMTYAQDFFSPDVESEDSLSFEFTIPTSGAYLTGAYIFIYSGNSETPIGSYDVEYRLEEVIANPHVGCYVLGSYDGRKWARLGGNERTGKFTNIGCLVERTDVRFLRVCLAGQVTGKTRIDYMEISANPSVLNTKIR